MQTGCAKEQMKKVALTSSKYDKAFAQFCLQHSLSSFKGSRLK